MFDKYTYLRRFLHIFERHGYVELFSSKMRNRSDAMPVEVLAFFCCFRVAILRRLEPENTSPLGPNRGAASARVGHRRPGSEWFRYAAFGRLDLLYLSIYLLTSPESP